MKLSPVHLARYKEIYFKIFTRNFIFFCTSTDDGTVELPTRFISINFLPKPLFSSDLDKETKDSLLPEDCSAIDDNCNSEIFADDIYKFICFMSEKQIEHLLSSVRCQYKRYKLNVSWKYDNIKLLVWADEYFTKDVTVDNILRTAANLEQEKEILVGSFSEWR